MKRLVLGAVVLVVAACDSKKADAPAPAAAAQKAAAAAAAPKPAAEPEKPVVIDEALLGKYLEAQKTIVADAKAFMETSRAELKEAAAKDSKLAALGAISRMEERNKKVEAAKAAAIAKAGLTVREYKEVNEAAGSVEMFRTMFEKAGGEENAAKMEATIKKELAAKVEKLSPEQREKAEADAAKMVSALRDMGNATVARKKYGDPAVEAILKRLPEIRALREELMALLKG